jgi:hypothetical protein
MNTLNEFRRCYVRAMILASVIFGFSHGVQLMAHSLIVQHSLSINPTGFLALIPYVLLESTIFFVIGFAVAYVPSRAANSFVTGSGQNNWIYHVSIGLIMGLVFLPLCASVPFLIFRFPDEPSYFARCIEYFLPMAAAGALGGYTFWLCRT